MTFFKLNLIDSLCFVPMTLWRCVCSICKAHFHDYESIEMPNVYIFPSYAEWGTFQRCSLGKNIRPMNPKSGKKIVADIECMGAQDVGSSLTICTVKGTNRYWMVSPAEARRRSYPILITKTA